MKKLFSILSFLFLATVFFTSCNKDDFDYEAAAKEQARQDSIERVRVDKLIQSQAASLKTFADNEMPGATLIDSLGIWFIIDNPGQEDSYTYSFNNNGQIIAPTVSVKYKGTLLNGTIFDQTETDKTATFNLGGLIKAWQIAFLPKSITFNGTTYPIIGLTNTGLKKGSKIRFATSSPFGYDQKSSAKIPANSPLYFEIEVVDIK